jgi:hypothetical protein
MVNQARYYHEYSEGAAQALEHDPIVARWAVVRAHAAWIMNKRRRLMPSGNSFQILPESVFVSIGMGDSSGTSGEAIAYVEALLKVYIAPARLRPWCRLFIGRASVHGSAQADWNHVNIKIQNGF